MKQLGKELDDLYLEIGSQLRADKTVKTPQFNRVIEIIDELKIQWHGQNLVDKHVVAMLHSLFIFMMGEANHAKLPEPIEDAAWLLSDRTRQLLREH